MNRMILFVVIGSHLFTSVRAAQECPVPASLPASGRPQVQSISYDGMKLKELVEAYREAYVAAGFKIKSQALLGDGKSVRLSLSIAIPGQATKNEGFGSLIFIPSFNTGADCQPCRVHRETMNVRYDELKAEEIVAAERVLYSADEAANVRIKKKLGKSLVDIRSTSSGGPC